MGEDIINQLPDDILISIITSISTVSTKEAVRTSILSKKWRNVYKFMSSINISCRCRSPTSRWEDPCDSEVIINGLHQVSQLHSGFVRSFEYSCCLTESSAHIFEECIYLLGKCIEKLVLQFSCLQQSRDFPFSCRLLSHMPSLTYFKLKYCTLKPNLNSHCNSLKIIRLSKVRALPGSLECILSNCLNLSSLLIRHCELPSKLCFRGPNLQLKCILISDWEYVEEIELYASNLITFEFYSAGIVNFIFNYVPQLQNIYLCSAKNTMSYCGRLGKDLPHLKSLLLDIQHSTYNIISPAQDSNMPMVINMFSNLKRLELCIYFASGYNLFSFTPLLHSCPLLQELHLATHAIPIKYAGPEVEKRVMEHSQLKKVDISGFGGTEDQLDFILYLFKSAVRLEDMYISWQCNVYCGCGKWEVVENPPHLPFCDKRSQIKFEYVEKLRHQAVSKTLQVIYGKFPRIKSKQFTKDGVLVD